jgi:uncharacterized membrane protein YsdA (DUF1294 family)
MKRYETWIWLAVFALLVFLFTHFDKKKDCNLNNARESRLWRCR